ncbi:signal peptidase I [Sphingomonas morindae]|uniref:Signal peptidase I n=1 Tax=Sphingomonas morindae TaxID=1541170 RepID=A0ABY4X9W8_9SPHN|nr:signal peptidase I [Sphingomonas morindae]USI73665.1 signal peptidase I [Sphingomonas morindae]
MPSSSSALRRPAPARAGGWRESVQSLLLFLLLALVLRTFVVMPRSIPSESMMPRLLVGDYVLVAKWPYGFSRFSLPFAPAAPAGRLFGRLPRRGDVVVFRAPPDDRHDYIKRLIGLPGDRVQMRAGRLWLNGRIVPRARIADFVVPLAANTECRSIALTPYGLSADAEGRPLCRLPRYRETLPDGRSYTIIDQGVTPQDDTPPVTVPPGHFFLMGDNRDISADSRFPATPGGGIGLVPFDNLEGRALITFFSSGAAFDWRHPIAWLAAIRADRIGQGFSS